MKSILASLRLVAVTMLVAVAMYSLLIFGIGALVTPATAAGSLITAADGTVVGSRQIAQNFTRPGYFWPRPSAVDYNGAGAGGSNKSPTSTDLRERAEQIVARYGATAERPLPPELAAASGGGLDPHISVRAARYQAGRVAEARALPLTDVEALIDRHSFAPGGPFTPERLVNILELNLALDALRAGDQAMEDESAP
jgi:K+-transporting ATPase ATPase C chain